MRLSQLVYCSVAITCIWVSACQAPLNLDAYNDQAKQVVQRYDAFQVANIVDKNTVILLGSDGVVVEYPELSFTTGERFIVAGKDSLTRPSFIASALCPSGKFFGLSFEGSVWERKSKNDWSEYKIDTIESVQDIACSNGDVLWVSASFSTLYKSTDGGKLWSEISQDEDTAFTQLTFPTPDIGYAFGEFGWVLKTIDNGKGWVRVNGVSEEFYPLSALFISENEGWVGGLRGSIYHTTDGALSWQKEPVESTAPIYNFSQMNDTVYAVGNYGTFLRRDLDGNWQSAKSGAAKSRGYLRGVVVSEGPDPKVFVAGQGYAASLPVSLMKFNKAQ